MRLKGIFIFGFIVLFLFGGGGYFLYKIYFGNNLVEDQISNNLISIASSKADRIKYFLDERKSDLNFFVNSDYIVDFFQDNISLNNKERIDVYIEGNSYLDFLFIDIEGKILYAGLEDRIGRDVFSVGSEVERIYEKVRRDFGAGIYSPGYLDENGKMMFYVTSPVLVDSINVVGKKEMVGLVAMRIDNYEIEKRIDYGIGFDDIGEIYLVDRKGVLVTDISGNKLDIVEIDTEIYRDCFKEYNNYYLSRHGSELYDFRKSGVFKNYLDDYVYGAHQFILEAGWCVIVEVDKNDFFDLIVKNEKDRYLILSYLFLGFLVFLLIFVFIIGRYFVIGGKK
jgi:hypothetical protein